MASNPEPKNQPDPKAEKVRELMDKFLQGAAPKSLKSGAAKKSIDSLKKLKDDKDLDA